MRARNITREAELAERLEIAASLWAKFAGLMGRAGLPHGGGLWLAESNGIHMFFMRFPIDAVFLGRPEPDGARLVVGLSARLPPWLGLVPFVRGAHGVLEVPAGTIEATGTAIGDRVMIGR